MWTAIHLVEKQNSQRMKNRIQSGQRRPLNRIFNVRSFIVLLLTQCGLAFHLPEQLAGFNPARPHCQVISSGRSQLNKSLPSKTRAYLSSEENSVDDTHPEIIQITAKSDVGDYDFDKKLGLQRKTAVVGAPQTVVDDYDSEISKMNITQVMTELQAIQSQGPKKYCILGTRHCSFLHQQIVEML